MKPQRAEAISGLLAHLEAGRHYSGDWIAGGLYTLSTFVGFYSTHYSDPDMQRTVTAHYPAMLAESAVLTLLTVPLLMSWRLGAWIAIAVQILGLLGTLAFIVVSGLFLVSDTQVIEAAMLCYCIARLRNSLGPPMIEVRPRRARAGIKLA